MSYPGTPQQVTSQPLTLGFEEDDIRAMALSHH